MTLAEKLGSRKALAEHGDCRMKIHIELTEIELRQLVKDKLESVLNVTLNESDILIEVKSKQNYRSEWETAAFRASVIKNQ